MRPQPRNRICREGVYIPLYSPRQELQIPRLTPHTLNPRPVLPKDIIAQSLERRCIRAHQASNILTAENIREDNAIMEKPLRFVSAVDILHAEIRSAQRNLHMGCAAAKSKRAAMVDIWCRSQMRRGELLLPGFCSSTTEVSHARRMGVQNLANLKRWSEVDSVL
jgi:hypothetical protein